MALVSYIKTLWKNGQAPARNESNLNKQEQGIFDVTEETLAQDSRIGINENEIVNLKKLNYYNFVKAQNITVAGNTYQEISRLADVIDAGTYEVKFSLTFTYNTTTKSAYNRFSLDNGATWFEFRQEPKDKTDNRAIYYGFPHVFVAGQTNIIVESRKEASGDTMIIEFLDIILERKV